MEVTKWLKPSGKRATNWWQRECAGRNASERRASLEKVDAQADPAAIPGKADTTGCMSEAGRYLRPPGTAPAREFRNWWERRFPTRTNHRCRCPIARSRTNANAATLGFLIAAKTTGAPATTGAWQVCALRKAKQTAVRAKTDARRLTGTSAGRARSTHSARTRCGRALTYRPSVESLLYSGYRRARARLQISSSFRRRTSSSSTSWTSGSPSCKRM